MTTDRSSSLPSSVRTRKIRRALAGASALGLFGLSVACGPGPEAKAPSHASYAGPSQARTSTSRDRSNVAITVYNGDFGLVREVRSVDLARGKVALEFRDVAEHVQPETVHIRSLTD